MNSERAPTTPDSLPRTLKLNLSRTVFTCLFYLREQAKKLRRHVDSEAYNQLVHEAETMPLPACEELVDKFSSFSHYN